MSLKEIAHKAVQANKDHQYALKVYTERLEAELEVVDKLLTAADVCHEDELDLNVGGSVLIPGSVRAVGPVSSSELLAGNSPFRRDALKRQRYVESTLYHPMKGPELEALADAVRSENYRIYALEAQMRGNSLGIDWERVAMKVSSSSTVQRSAKECEIRWLGERHPQFSNTPWTQAEIAKVKELVHGLAAGQIDWVEIAEKLGTQRTPVDCMRHAITRKAHVWNSDSDNRLIEAVKIYGADNWMLVARFVSEDATASQCQNRYMRTLDPSIKRGAWTEDEDARLRQAVAVFGNSWVDIATFVPGRNNEQCRDRYQEYLNPTVTKGKWTPDQDQALLHAVEQVGESKWKEVSQLLNIGRTDNMCRVRYVLLMKRKQKSTTASPSPAEPSGSGSPFVLEPPTPGAREQSAPSQPTHSRARSFRPETPSTEAAAGPSVEPVVQKPRPRPRKRKRDAILEDNSGPHATGATPPEPTPDVQGDNTVVSQGSDIGRTAEASATRKSSRAPAKRPLSASANVQSQPNKRRRTARELTQAADEPVSVDATDADSASPQLEVAPSESAAISTNVPCSTGRDPSLQQPTHEVAPARIPPTPSTVPSKSPKKSPHKPTSRPRGRHVAQVTVPETAPSAEPTASNVVPSAETQRGSRGGKKVTSIAPEPTRRQPRRAANKASRPLPQEGRTVSGGESSHPIPSQLSEPRTIKTTSQIQPTEIVDSDLSSVPTTPEERR
ncbi:snRNA-activating protein complex subunit 4 [Grifola frondosa]|uniref:snRNA-activating protein complex subunit 4 n=1 Tax=Grifola frondosa TaxID=5627 RepID=A0A1C7MJG7_GRIFR|nr:snRNA-activating protein complex subunit 4 [Grifola frondosa]